MPRPISVIVPTRDRPEQLGTSLAALRRELGPQDEIVVADSASQRDAEVRAAAEREGARYVRCARRGASRARNAGWRAAAHDLVAFVDDDVQVAPGWRAAIDATAAWADGATFVTGRVETPPDQRTTARPIALVLHERAFDIGPETVGAIGGSGNLVVEASALREVGGFDEALGAGGRFRAAEDHDLFDRLLAAGHRGRHEPTIEAWHEQWRRTAQAVPLAFAYGMGTGARLAKLVRADPRRARLAAEDYVWTWGVLDLLRCIRVRSRLGVATATARLAGTAAGFARAVVRPVRHGHLGRAGAPRPLLVDARRLSPPRTGAGNQLAALVEAWQGDPAVAGRVRLLTRRGDEPPVGVALPSTALRGGPLWHARAAREVWREDGRYLSPESLIVPILVGRRATVIVNDLTALRLPEAHTRRTRLAFRLLLGPAVHRVRRVVVPSQATAAELSAEHPRAAGRTAVVHSTRRKMAVRERPPHGGGRYVLFVGTLEPRKNVDVLVRAFGRAAPEGWTLVLVGRWGWLREPERRRLEARIHADPRVEHRGFVDDAELADLYAGAGVFAYPSSYEGFGLPVLEAMAFGLPVIVTDTPALAEVAGTAGLVLPTGDLHAALQAALAQVLGDPDLRVELGRRSTERARVLAEEARHTPAVVAHLCLDGDP